ncbi:MAG: ADOP family duplicated permease [Bryobacteraceae bacterium]
MHSIWQTFRALLRRRTLDRELDDEIRAHLAIDAAQRIEAGQAAEQARHAARRDFGNVALVAEVTREMRGSGPIERFLQDLRYGWRTLGRNRGFTLAVVVILALGIGANTAVFSLVNAAILKPLPVEAPGQLVWFDSPSFSYPIFKEVQSRGKEVFTRVFAWTFVNRFNVEWDQDAQQPPLLLASGEFYSTLGVAPALGRLFGPQDDLPDGGLQGPVAVISYDCWQRRFNADPAVIGRTVRIERTAVPIIGVTPRGFYGVAPGLSPDITLPLTLGPRLNPHYANLRNGQSAWVHLMARLRPEVPHEQANAALQVFWPQVMDAATGPSLPRDRRARFLARRAQLQPGATGFSSVRNRFREPLFVLLGMVGLLLLAACASVANLLLVRASARHREIAVRLALGAGQRRITLQLLTEGLLLAFFAAIAALLIAGWGGSILVALMSTERAPVALELSPDWRVFLFTLATSLVTAILFSLAPAIRARRIDPGPALKENSRSASRWLFGKTLVATQVALAVLVLAGAALFARSLVHLTSLDPGFDHRRLLTVRADAVNAGYRDARLRGYYDQASERIRRVPGVESVSLSWVPPLTATGAWSEFIAIDGLPRPRADVSRTFFNPVSPGYFATVGQRLVTGRDFGVEDNQTGVRTCIVTESLARSFFPGQDPIGHRISIGEYAERQNVTIVGVVSDAKYAQLQEPPRRIVYLPLFQSPEAMSSTLVFTVRAAVPPATLAGPIRSALRELDAGLLIRIETYTERFRELLVTERVIAVISLFLGTTALLLASAGLYGVIAYTVSRRTSEIGIRIALGAPRAAVAWMVLRSSVLLCAIGLSLGIGASLALGRFAAGLLHGIKPTDPIALATAATLMLVIALVASWIPSRRAARIDPTVALRYE